MIPPRLAAFASRIGLTGLAIAVLLALLAVQTVRLEGMKIWPLSIEGALPKLARYEATFAEIERTTRETTAKWKAAIDAKEQFYRNKAKEADDNAEEAMSGAMAAAERHIANNRVCPGNRGGVQRPATDAGSGSAGGDNGPDRSAELVAVTEDDIRVCTTNTIRLEAAREWGLSLPTASD